MDHRPSMIAAAAVLAASDANMTRQAVELKMNVVPCWDSLEIVSFPISMNHLLEFIKVLIVNVF